MKTLREFLCENVSLFSLKEKVERSLWVEFTKARKQAWEKFELGAKRELVGKSVIVNGYSLKVDNVVVRKHIDSTVPSPFLIEFDVRGTDLSTGKFISVTVVGGLLRNKISLLP